MFQRPTTAKKLYFDVIPKAVDEYMTFLDKLEEQEDAKALENPAWYIHNGDVPEGQRSAISFALLLNLTSAANTDDPAVIWNFIQKYAANATPENSPFLDHLVGYAIKYYERFVLPQKSYRAPDERERTALSDLAMRLGNLADGLEADEYMTEVFSAGKENGYDKSELRDWFQAIYQVLLGETQGPRFGSFVALYGRIETITLIEKALAGDLLQAA